MLWVKWDSLENFNNWHDIIKNALSLPKPSVDENGHVIEGSVIVTDYVQPTIVSENDVRALIDDIYSDGLEVSSDPYVSKYEASPK
jgi:hypothetical protein